jgi:dTDP-4-dehydrorhamnose 3,5-epimerase
MKVHPTRLSGTLLLEPKVYGDSRGFFLESWNDRVFRELGIQETFVQDNHSFSYRGTLRGLHYQLPRPQGKLVWVIEGEVYDVLVDMRNFSPTFGQWESFYINAENKFRVWVPPGFAHGFYVTSERAQFCYKCTEWYAPEYEKVLAWNAPELAIEWPLPSEEKPLISQKDSQGLSFSEASPYSQLTEPPSVAHLAKEFRARKILASLPKRHGR